MPYVNIKITREGGPDGTGAGAEEKARLIMYNLHGEDLKAVMKMGPRFANAKNPTGMCINPSSI